MRVKELQLKNFKRFTDLTIRDIPEDCKLVLLIGTNGSGKSSVFDAFEVLGATNKSGIELGDDGIPVSIPGIMGISDLAYYHKDDYDLIHGQYPLAEIKITGSNKERLEASLNYAGVILQKKEKISENAFYGRSAIRYVPRLTKTVIGKVNEAEIKSDNDRPRFYIDEDKRFENDIDILIQEVIAKVFKGINDNSPAKFDELKSFLKRMDGAFQRIFGENDTTTLALKSLLPPAEGLPCKILFQKGASEVNYDLLSAGEKEVVNLLFNLFVRNKYHEDTIYFFDEIDAHLNTKLQYNLIKEVTENWIPENCQLWTASHSLGFIDYARDYSNATIIDFDNLDFDLPQVLEPARKNFTIYDISIPKEMMDKLYDQGKRVVVCENENDEWLNRMTGFTDFYFAGVADSNSVFARIKDDSRIWGIRDRDFLTTGEIMKLRSKYPNYRILDLYCFENYLYHPDNIIELNLPGFDRQAYIGDILKQKKDKQNIIIPNLGSSRKGYEEFKLDVVERDRDLTEIVEALGSDDFNHFYPFYSMKEHKKLYTGNFNLNKANLIGTNWFKTQFEKILQ
jgi:AAA15 family ATPase/GTPase